MKRLFTLLVSVFLIFSLVSCGSDSNSNTGVGTNQASGKEIRFDPSYVVLDDENAKIEITSLSEKLNNEGTESEFTEYEVHFTTTNKSKVYDLRFSVSLGDAAVGGYTVQFGNSNNITKAGRINDTGKFVAIKYTSKSDGSTQGIEHIQSLEDLLKFCADASVTTFTDEGKTVHTKDWYKVSFSLEDMPSSSIKR